MWDWLIPDLNKFSILSGPAVVRYFPRTEVSVKYWLYLDITKVRIREKGEVDF